MSCGIDRKHGLDSALLWLWCRPAATVLIQPLTWEPPYAMGAALKRQKKNCVLSINNILQLTQNLTSVLSNNIITIITT